ncbi:MAG: hypothetical protein K5770_04125 [Lachnospiraceae bacterium]|nr:hypothetical protein [Lachnospiraceae bacterium]
MYYGDEEDDGSYGEGKEEHEVDYQLEGLWDGIDSSTGLTDRNTYSMAEIAGIELLIAKPVYSDFYKRTGDMRFYDPIVADTDLEVEEKVLPKGQYRLRYSIMDMIGRTYNSDFVYVAWDGEKAVFKALPEEEAPKEAEDAENAENAEDADAADTEAAAGSAEISE